VWQGVAWMHLAQYRDQWWPPLTNMVRSGEFFDQLSDYYLLNKDSVSQSYGVSELVWSVCRLVVPK
jgi:hypothetical protein